MLLLASVNLAMIESVRNHNEYDVGVIERSEEARKGVRRKLVLSDSEILNNFNVTSVGSISMQLLALILSPFKKDRAPVEEDTSDEDSKTMTSKSNRRKKKSTKEISTRRPTRQQAKKGKRRVATRTKKTNLKGKAVKVKKEPARRSRRTKGYKKGSLNEKTLRDKVWKGSGSRDDPYVLVSH